MGRRRSALIAIIIAGATLGGVATALATQSPGPGLDPDAMAYTGAATSLVHQGRLRVPTSDWDAADSTSSLSLWPPGYPAAIAVPMLAGVTPVQSARWIGVGAYALTLGAAALLLGTLIGDGAAVVVVLVLLATTAVFDVHISVLSEPLFIALTMVFFATIVLARDRIFFASIIATMLVSVRYAGAYAPAALCIWQLVDSRYSAAGRMKRASLAAILPIIAIAAWFTRTALAPDRHETPTLQVYGGWTASLSEARDTLSAWLVPLLDPSVMRTLVAGVVAIVMIGFVLATVRDTARGRHARPAAARVRTMVGAASVICACYVAVIVVSRAFVGGTIPLDWRILSPLIAILDVVFVAMIAYWWQAYHVPSRAVVIGASLAWLLAAATTTANDAVYAATTGSDFAELSWRRSPLVNWIRMHGRGHPLYTNWPPAVYFHASRIAREMPDSLTSDDKAELAEKFRSTHALLIEFNTPSPDGIPPAALADSLGLHEIARVGDGRVWASDSSASISSSAGSSRQH